MLQKIAMLEIESDPERGLLVMDGKVLPCG